tara:strand:- start:134 stop:442 length:309 start_codon:yes stop_codon:yes gene_type:complete
MAVSRREKNSDSNYVSAIGSRPVESNKEPDLLDVIEDLRDDMNSMCDLSASNEAKVSFDTTSQAVVAMIRDYSFTFTAASGRTPARLTIQHLSTRTNFTIDA